MNFRPHKFPIVNILGEINTSPLLFHTCAHTYTHTLKLQNTCKQPEINKQNLVECYTKGPLLSLTFSPWFSDTDIY